jgi:hypothetical protein
MVKQCGLFDLAYNGIAYTWRNKHFNSNPTYEHLDRFLANAEWCKAYLATMVYHLPMMRSNHAPILTVLQSNHFRTNKSFKFENWWTLE